MARFNMRERPSARRASSLSFCSLSLFPPYHDQVLIAFHALGGGGPVLGGRLGGWGGAEGDGGREMERREHRGCMRRPPSSKSQREKSCLRGRSGAHLWRPQAPAADRDRPAAWLCHTAKASRSAPPLSQDTAHRFVPAAVGAGRRSGGPPFLAPPGLGAPPPGLALPPLATGGRLNLLWDGVVVVIGAA